VGGRGGRGFDIGGSGVSVNRHNKAHMCMHNNYLQTYIHAHNLHTLLLWYVLSIRTWRRIFSRRPSRFTRFLADTSADSTSPVLFCVCFVVRVNGKAVCGCVRERKKS
jgi:hypothetical protein